MAEQSGSGISNDEPETAVKKQKIVHVDMDDKAKVEFSGNIEGTEIKKRHRHRVEKPQPPRPEPRPDRCHFFMERKRRYCQVPHTPAGDNKYCVVHSSHLNLETCRKRIKCPLDPKHCCYEDALQKHLKKCNAREGNHPIYFVKDINSGEAEQITDADKVSVLNASHDELMATIEKLKHLHKEHVKDIPTEICTHKGLVEDIEKSMDGGPARKHLKQQASLIGHMEEAGLLKDDVCFIEFGAGRGGLSHAVQKCTDDKTNTQFILIEKGGTRYKMDIQHREENQGPQFERLRIDIQHLDLEKVPSLQNNPRTLVSIGKHLCGGATDLMLRCLMKSEDSPQTITKSSSGIVLALCCHHRCDWRSYVGKPFFKSVGLSSREYSLLASMSSWAVCATPTWLSKLNDEHDSEGGIDQRLLETTNPDYNHPRYGKLSPADRERLGYMSKELIDIGRLQYIEDHQYEPRLIHYIESDITLENTMLIATPKAK